MMSSLFQNTLKQNKEASRAADQNSANSIADLLRGSGSKGNDSNQGNSGFTSQDRVQASIMANIKGNQRMSSDEEEERTQFENHLASNMKHEVQSTNVKEELRNQQMQMMNQPKQDYGMHQPVHHKMEQNMIN